MVAKSNTQGWHRIRLVIPAVSLTEGSVLALDKAQVHYLTSVLRQSAGAVIYVCDGAGSEATCKLVQTGKSKFAVEVGPLGEYRGADAKREIHIGQGAAPRNRLDWAVEKMTEVGVSSIAMLSDFGTKKKDKPVASQARWERIANAATAQCGRMYLPKITSGISFHDWQASLPDGALRLVLVPGAEQVLSSAIASQATSNPVAIVIGRTTGLSSDEEDAVIEYGFQAVNLGERVLRSETVGTIVTSMLLISSGEC